MKTALVIILLFSLLALSLGLLARGGRRMNLQQWTVGGRSFGTVFVFLLMAGEIYTTFTLLGGSGFAYGKGAAVYYILMYCTLAYVYSYWLLPPIWRFAKRHDIVSQPEYFRQRYQSRPLSVLVAAVGVVASIPYLALQLKGLGIIVQVASYGSVSASTAIWLGVLLLAVYVVVSGVHGSAWTAVVKDVTVLAITVFLGIYLPIHYYGGFTDMFRAIDQMKPGFLTFSPGGTSFTWFQSTVLLAATGFFMWPFSFTSIFTAKSEQVFRRNAVSLPIYQLILLFVFFVGFAAILRIPDLKGGDIDLALFRLSAQTFDPWFVGIIGGIGVLTALVPGSLLLISTSTSIANDLYRGALNPRASDVTVGRVARVLVPLVALVSAYFALNGGGALVSLLLMGYSLVTQLFPGVLFSVCNVRRITASGVFCGIFAGELCVIVATLTHSNLATIMPFLPPLFKDINVGFAALILNVTVAFAVGFGTQLRSRSMSVS
jgi:solute:Na+ symporter, SSS family